MQREVTPLVIHHVCRTFRQHTHTHTHENVPVVIVQVSEVPAIPGFNIEIYHAVLNLPYKI